MGAGWNDVSTQITGYLVTAADWNDGVVYNCRYLKGKDGAIEIEDAMQIDGNVTFPGAETVDGVDISAHAGNSDAHHNEAHHAAHENGGGDEISVAGLSGELADNQPPKAHASSHEDGGSDEIDVSGLTGLPVIGTYTGNSSGATRQITTGFQCAFVIISGPDESTGIGAYEVAAFLSDTAGANTVIAYEGDKVIADADIYLHAANGFVVGDASNHLNVNSDVYVYVAFPA